MEKLIYGYWVDSRGFVWNKKHTKPLVGKTNRGGYHQLFLRPDGRKPMSICEHRMVALAFVDNPNPEVYKTVNHINCDKYDNRPENLEWLDQQGQIDHAWANNLMHPKGPKRRIVLHNKVTNETLDFESHGAASDYFGVGIEYVAGKHQSKKWRDWEDVTDKFAVDAEVI